MTNAPGHIGMALLLSAVAWAIWTGRTPVMFAALSLVTAMVPDVDLVLRHVLPIEHHGITHTVVFVVVVAVVMGALATQLLREPLNRLWRRPKADRPSGRKLFWFVGGAFLVGGLAHIVTDLLSAPDIAEPLAPFWPVYDQHVVLDLVWYASPWANFGLLVAGVLAHLVLIRVTDRASLSSLVR